jgi:hypothetical protein
MKIYYYKHFSKIVLLEVPILKYSFQLEKKTYNVKAFQNN